MAGHELNQVVTPVVAAMPDVASLSESVNTSPGSQDAAVHPTNAFSTPVHEACQSSLLSASKASSTLSVVPQGYVSFPVLCFSLIPSNLHLLSLLQISHWPG